MLLPRSLLMRSTAQTTRYPTAVELKKSQNLLPCPHLIKKLWKEHAGPPVLCGVVRDGETFDFCMCNPPFFESMEEAGLNPKTSCGGMVCPGGENAFITRIIEDSVHLKHIFRRYTSMVGRKTNLKSLHAKLREVRVTIVKTTEFVQGQTCRWGIAWSFVHPLRKIVTAQAASEKRNLYFMLEGLQRQISAMDVLKFIESFFLVSGTSCKLNVHSFSVDITVSRDNLNEILMSKGIVEKASAASICTRVMRSQTLCSDRQYT